MPQPLPATFTRQFLEQIARTHYAEMRKAARDVLKNDVDAEDAVQNYLISLQGKPVSPAAEKLGNFLCVGAANHARSIIRKRTAEKETPNRGGPVMDDEVISAHHRHRPPRRPADAAKTDSRPQPVNPVQDPEVFASPVLARLRERLKNKPAMLRALEWDLSTDPATRQNQDLAKEANVTQGAVTPSIDGVCAEALLAYQDVYGERPSVRLKKSKITSATVRKLLDGAKKAGRHGKD